ncbi:hypothetical protein [Longitalea arenae]|uniref:hypothetical protein n=1 Tax=Longitalea arenae TaxID=2812558 RepID=UPI001967641D|nr:hypothetical protein [Longitalea arenae]
MFARAIIAVLFFSFIHGRLWAQHNSNKKIDLPFRLLIAERSPSDTLLKKYDCIIYTTQPEALRKMGITVRTSSPRAVTAVATLQQILTAAAMPEVKFIEAPEYLKMHRK